MKQLIILFVFTLGFVFAQGQVKQCNGVNCRMFLIKKSADKITVTNISHKLIFVFGFCETEDGKWQTNYSDFAPLFPKSQEDIQNLQYSCGTIRCSNWKKKLTGKFYIFYYYAGEKADLSVADMKAICAKK